MISRDEIREAVKLGIKTVTSRSATDIGDSDQLADHEIDSLDGMSVMLEVEDSLGISFGDLDPKRVTSIDDFVEVIQEIEREGVKTPE